MNRRELETLLINHIDMYRNGLIGKEAYQEGTSNISKKILKLLIPTLKRYGYPHAFPSKVNEDDIVKLDLWIKNQEVLFHRFQSLLPRAEEVELTLVCTPPYTQESLKKEELRIRKKEKHWLHCSILEDRWSAMGVTKNIDRDKSSNDLSIEEEFLSLQENL